MNYSLGNTVLVWFDDDSLLEMTKKISSDLNLNVFEANYETDILAVPYFFAIIDGNKINKNILSDLTEIISSENPKEFAVLLTSQPDCQIQGSIKKFFIKQQEVITANWLKTTILNKKSAITRHKNNKRSYDKTIFKTVYIIRKLMKKNSIIFLDELCTQFNVSEKTIKRDIELLKSMGEDIVYDKNRKGYCLEFSLNGILFKKD